MFANKRTARTIWRINRPGDFDHEHQSPECRLEPPGDVHVRHDAPANSPTTPISRIPALDHDSQRHEASAAVTLTLPVADAPPGIMPSKLLNSTKKKAVHR